jgi:NADH dehydrogenase FAD-containing subunit
MLDLRTNTKHEQNTDIIISTLGTEPCELIQKTTQLSKDKNNGKILTLKTLQTQNFANVFAIGDCATVIDYNSMPSTAQVVSQQVDIVTKNIVLKMKELISLRKNNNNIYNNNSNKNNFNNNNNDINNNNENNILMKSLFSFSRDESYYLNPKLKEFKFHQLGEMITFGELDASVSMLNGYIGFSGSFAAIARRFLYVFKMPTNAQVYISFFLTISAIVKYLYRLFFKKK